MDIRDLGRHEPALPHHPDAVVVGRAPDAVVRRDPHAELAGRLERALLREFRIAGDVERELQPSHVIGLGALDEAAEVSRVRPLPRRAEQVAVGEDEPSR
jgi:hypothetical protein